MGRSGSRSYGRLASYVCAWCSGRVVPVVYGLPDAELAAAADEGTVVLGGCILTDQLPQGRCRDCGADVSALGQRRWVTSWRELYEASGTEDDGDLAGWLDDHCELDGCWIDHAPDGPIVAVGQIGVEYRFPFVLADMCRWLSEEDFSEWWGNDGGDGLSK